MHTLNKAIGFILAFVLLSCNAAIRANKEHAHTQIDERFTSGRVDDEEHKFLRSYLENYANGPLKDTIIIRYDFNSPSCWDFLDSQNDRYIKKVLAHHRSMVQQYKEVHHGTSVFEFRETGDYMNKYKKWNTDILLDSSYVVLNVIVKERARCGTSVMVLPFGKFIKIKNDPHSEILYLSDQQIIQLVEKATK